MKRVQKTESIEYPYSDNHLLAAIKPSGLPSQPDASGDVSLIDLAKEHIRREFSKPGAVYLALLHRLDRPTSGLVLLARTDKAAGRMADAFRRRDVDKMYLALVECHSDPGPGRELADLLEPVGNGGMKIAARGGNGAKEARLGYRTLAVWGDGRRALLAVKLETGVKHQIRCQLARAGLPVVGDFRYGPGGKPARPTPVADGHAVLLHAWKLGFVHPVRKEAMELSAPPPGHWRSFLTEMSLNGTDLESL